MSEESGRLQTERLEINYPGIYELPGLQEIDLITKSSDFSKFQGNKSSFPIPISWLRPCLNARYHCAAAYPPMTKYPAYVCRIRHQQDQTAKAHHT